MKSNYNQLGQYIEMVSRTNSDLKYGIEDVRGCSNTKQMMQTRANLIGRTYEKFIVLRPQEFVFNRRTTRNGEKIGMAYNNTDREYIFTNDYVAFRVKQEYLDKLLPDYLYLFFCRDEFDRYARYKSTGSATEFFNWEDMCAVPFEIPPMDFQQLVVNAYKVLNKRIETKQKINDNLEATLNTVFVKMYEETDEDSSVLLSELCSLASSKRVFAEDYVSDGVPFYRGKEITQKRNGEPISDPLFISHNHFASLKANYGIPVCGDILITAVGTIGNSYFVQDEEFYFKDGNIIWLKDFIEPSLNYYIYDYMQTPIFKRQLEGICIGSTQTALTIVALSNLKVKKPRTAELALYCKKSKALRSAIQTNNGEIERLTQVAKAMLASLSR